jgi:hypothetical protein
MNLGRCWEKHGWLLDLQKEKEKITVAEKHAYLSAVMSKEA